MGDRTQKDVVKLVEVARRRRRISVGLLGSSLALVLLSALAVLLTIADRLGPAPWVPWWGVISASIVLAAGLGFAAWWRTRPSDLETARQVDERLGLKDRLSSAVACGRRDDGFARAVQEEAARIASSSRTIEATRRGFRIETPPFWWASPILILVAVLISQLGQWSTSSPGAERAEVSLTQVRQQAEASIEASLDAVRADPELQDALSEVLEDLSTSEDPEDAPRVEDEESIRRQALKQVSGLDRHLEDLVEGPQGQTLEQLTEALQDLNRPEDSPIKPILDSLAESDFAAANQSLESFRNAADEGELDSAQLTAAAEAFDALAEDLEEAANSQEEMKQALRQAGLDPSLSDDPEAMDQAIRQADDLNESQKRQLQDKADATRRAEAMLESLAEAAADSSESLRESADDPTAPPSTPGAPRSPEGDDPTADPPPMGENGGSEPSSDRDRQADGESSDGLDSSASQTPAADPATAEGQPSPASIPSEPAPAAPALDSSGPSSTPEPPSPEDANASEASPASEDPGDEMSRQLTAMEQLQDMINQAEAARETCQQQCRSLGQGLSKQSATTPGSESGGQMSRPSQRPGVGEAGRGSPVGELETPTSFVKQDDSGPGRDGPVISRVPVPQDTPVTGESLLPLQQAQQASKKGFDQAISDARLPRQYREVLKHYFGNRSAVEQAVESDASTGKAAPESPVKGASGGED